MFVVTVYVQVKPDYVDAFIEATNENASQSRLEPGIARFDVIQSLDDACRFVLIEVYRDEEAPKAHKETDHYKKWRESVEEMMDEPRTNQKYRSISPEASGW